MRIKFKLPRWVEQARFAHYVKVCELSQDMGGCKPTRWTKLQAAWKVANNYADRLYCYLFDHDYTTDGADYPDSGGEGFTCKHCGHSFTAWH